MRDQQAFEDLVKDILTKLYDTTALETHHTQGAAALL